MIQVNHVLSSDKGSKIFSDIIGRIERDVPKNFKVEVSERPNLSGNVDICHYHRPNMETTFHKRSVCTVHHDLNDYDKWLRFEKFEEAYRQMRLIFCLNHTQQQILNAKGINQTVVLPHGVDTKLFIPENKVKGNKKVVIGLFSRFYKRKVKGEDYLLELAKHLDNQKFSFLLVGEGRQTTASLLSQLGFDIEFHEVLPYRMFPRLYEKTDVLLVTSLFEGGPACVPEALAMNVPIISTKVGMSIDFIQEGINGFFIEGNIKKDIDSFHKLPDLKMNGTLASNRSWSVPKVKDWREINKKLFDHYSRILREES